jgi:pimeloyl-ACP methyl ester carboxylesterase
MHTRNRIGKRQVAAFAGLVVGCVVTAALAGDGPKDNADHQDLSYVRAADGARRPIRTADDWAARRAQIVAAMERVMGPFPSPAEPVPLSVEILEEAPVEGAPSLIRKKLRYHTDSPDEWVHAYLFVPQAESERLPAMLCLHQTTSIGKSEPAGLGGNPNLHYALHLAKRGYVTLAPDYPSFGDSKCDFTSSRYASGSMQAIYDNTRAIDLLQSLDVVDADRIGCIGHSLGGHNSMFTAVFEPRIKVIISNCGFTRFHKYYAGRLAGWTSARYMPRIASEFHNSPDEVPFDFPEIVACFAPRPFLASAPVRDDNFEVSGVRDTIAAAKPIYELLGAGEALQANYPESAHDFPEEARVRAYAFLDRYLKR